jgi:hypothetical protein
MVACYRVNFIFYLTKHHIQNKYVDDMKLLAHIYIKHAVTGWCPRGSKAQWIKHRSIQCHQQVKWDVTCIELNASVAIWYCFYLLHSNSIYKCQLVQLCCVEQKHYVIDFYNSEMRHMSTCILYVVFAIEMVRMLQWNISPTLKYILQCA